MSKYQGISTLEILTGAKNYNKWISEQIADYLTPPVLEIGAGTGNITSLFIDKKPLYVSDTDPSLVAGLKKKFKNEKNILICKLDTTKKPPVEFTGFFNSIYAVNVLEHIEDDTHALKNMRAMLRKNGKLVLLVPAKKFAYTRLDKELGHFRRYEKKELKEKLLNAGYQVEKIQFFNIVGLISWYIRDKVSRNNFNLKPYQIKIFDSTVPFLKTIESSVKIPIGISLIVVAHKLIKDESKD